MGLTDTTIGKYMSMVKFSHTIFAMPFALLSYVYALVHNHIAFDWLVLFKILLCMVFARNAAMGFNRWADRHIDAANPRTKTRELPSGKISPLAAFLFVIANAAAFVITACFINKLTLILSPVALFVILGYSFTKRFTAWSHIVLGTALAIAPVGAYIAVTGSIAVVPILLAGIVVTWVSGFDILYSLQDAGYDKQNGLHSIPARFSPSTSVGISIFLHVITLYAVAVMGLTINTGTLYWIGAGLFTALLVYQHFIFLPSRLDRIGASFGLVNGCSSLLFATFAIISLLL